MVPPSCSLRFARVARVARTADAARSGGRRRRRRGVSVDQLHPRTRRRRDAGLVEVLREVLDGAAHRHRCQPAHRAQRSVDHRLAQVVEEHEILVAFLVGDDAVDDLDPAHRPDPAGRALAAGLLGAELHREPGLNCHVDGVVEDHHAAVPDHRAGRSERLVVEREVELLLREIGAERATDLHGAHRATRARAAAVAVDEVAEADPERRLDDATALDVPGELEDLGAARALDAQIGVRRSTLGEDAGHRRESDHVVDDSRLAEQTRQRRDRRLRADHPALALEALQHRGLLAADVGTRADPDLEVERQVGAEHRRTEHTAAVGDLDGGAQRLGGRGVLRAEVDVAHAGADGTSGDQHALDQGERVTLHEHPVGVRAGVALVGVAADVLLLAAVRTATGLHHRLPLDPGREAGAAASAQPRLGDLLGHLLRREVEGSAQSGETAVLLVLVERERVDDADPRERDAVLVAQPLHLVGESVRETVVGPVEEALVDEPVDVGGCHRAVGDAPAVGRDLDHRLEPEQAARAVADDGDVATLLGRGERDPVSDLVGTDRAGG